MLRGAVASLCTEAVGLMHRHGCLSNMRVSVIICGYTMDRFEVITAAIDSVLAQTHRPLEVIIIIDGNFNLYDRISTIYCDKPAIHIELNDQNRGISYSRTRGAELATGEVVAFIDDDAVAEPNWIAEHVRVYEESDAVAVAGPVVPMWTETEPRWFPSEFYWLVGCTEPGFAEDGDEIRNGYGSNVSYLREVFLEVGGYDVNTGRKGDRHIQAHEAPVGIKLRDRCNKSVIFKVDAKVHHRLFMYRGRFTWLLRRSFWQGYSKRLMQRLYTHNQENEREFALGVILHGIPRRMQATVRDKSITPLLQICTSIIFIIAAIIGFIYAVVSREQNGS